MLLVNLVSYFEEKLPRLHPNNLQKRELKRPENLPYAGLNQTTCAKPSIFRAFSLWSILVLITLFGAASAQAQTVDWVVNIDDTGFDPIPAGGTIDYAITVANNGSGPAPATTIDLTVDAGTTLTASSGTITGCAPIPTVGLGTVTCNVPALAAFTSATLNVDVLTSVQGTNTLGASVPIAGDDDPANNAVSESTTVTTAADIDLTVTGPGSAGSGSNVTYTFTATNNGPNTADSLTFEFPIPTGLVNITPPSGCNLVGSTYSCAIPGPIVDGGSVDLDFSGQISAASGSTVTPLASIVSTVPDDPITSNNLVSMDTTVTAGSDVMLAKSRAPAGNLLIGDTATFTLSPSYTGDSPSGLTVSDTVPANYVITTASPFTSNSWSCTVTGQQIDCTKTTGSGAGANVSLGDIEFDTVVDSAGTPTNTATIAAAGPADPFPGNNIANDGGATIEEPTVDLRANKSGPVPALVVIGQQYNFSISATNIGNADFFGTLVMTDHLPAGLTVDSYGLSGWTCLPAVPVVGATDITCERVYTEASPLVSGATAPSVTLATTATATGSLANSMTVSSPDANIADVNPGNDTTTYAVVGSIGDDSADVSIIKTATLATVAAGDVQTFTLEVMNAGPQPSQNVELLDNFTGLMNNSIGATGAGYISEVVVSNAASGMTCSTAATGGTSRRLTCNITTLPICVAGVDCPTVTVQVRPGGNGSGRTNNASAISDTTADPNLNNNSDSANFTVDPRADIIVTKDGAPSPAKAGQDLTYVLTAQNVGNGLSAADAVTVTDTLPDDLTFVSASPSTGSCSVLPNTSSPTGAGNNQVVCNLGTINNGAQQTVTILVRPNTVTRGTTLVNNASVTTDTTETDSGNNTASLSTPVEDPALDLLVNKSETPDPVAVGDTTLYTVTVTNLGPSTAENVVLTDVMPASRLSFQSHTVDAGGSCSSVPGVGSFGQTLTCNFPTVLAGQTKTVTINALGTAKGVATNSASISSDELAAGFDTNSGNDSTTEDTTVRTKADVEVVSKIATPNPVNLRDNFNFVIQVRNNSGAGLAEADDVSVSDSLPTNMVLTGAPSIAIVSGSTTSSTCTGAAGGTSFSCNLGTFSSGGVVNITVPVEVTSISSQGQVFTNQADITTSSLDVNGANNTNTGNVTVNASSISGELYRDFNDNGGIDAGDTGVGGVTMTLTGTDLDGNAVTRTATTNADGTYTFPLLPEGTYTISRGTPGEPNYTDGTDTPGATGGTASGPNAINNIPLAGNETATDYLFAIVPTASIGIAKSVNAGPTPNADGSFNVTYRLAVENLSLEALDNIVVTDQLEGAAPLHGTFVALGTPATDAMARGQYTMLNPPSGSCGSVNGGYNGAGSTSAANGFTLAIGATCQIDIAIRVQPTVPFPVVLPSGGRYENQAVVTGEGVLSGQTSATNPQLSDLSDNGTNPDPDSDRTADEAGENDPTPVAPSFNASIALVKTADTSAFSTPTAIGDEISYSFTVTNIGDVTLTNISISDPLAGIVLSGGPIASLAPGDSDSVTITATYQIDQDDIDAGEVVNQATVQGTDPFDNVVTDPSGTNTGNDDPTVATIAQTPDIALIKMADDSALSNPSVPGEIISYSFTVENTGNVTLTNVTISDILPGIVLSGGPIASMAPGDVDSTTFTATYAVTTDDIDAGEVVNQATATGNDPDNNPVTDLSGTDNTDDSPITIPLYPAPSIALIKTADVSALSSPPLEGETISYSFTVENTGNVTLTNVTISDILPGIVLTGGPIASMAPGDVDSATFTATYALTQVDVDAGEVINQATVTGNDPNGNPVTDLSGTTNTDDTPLTTPLAQTPSIALIKTADVSALSSPPLEGETISYSFTVENTGNVTLTNVTISDILPGIVLSGGPIASMAPGDVDSATFTATYALTQIDIDAGEVINQATVTGNDPDNSPVTDLSGTDAISDDPTTTPIPQTPAIDLVKTADLSGFPNGVATEGDTVPYSFTITNTGNVTLTNVTLADPLPGIVLLGGPIATMAPGDVDSTTFTANYTVTAADLTAGQVDNTATATGQYGVDGSGNPVTVQDDDLESFIVVSVEALPEVFPPFTADGGITTSVLDSDTHSGGPATLTNVTISVIASDPEVTLDPATGLITLSPGNPAGEYTVTYEICSVIVPTVCDQTTETVVQSALPAIETTKTQTLTDNGDGIDGVGDQITYTITVENTGNVPLENLVLADTLTTIGGAPLILDSGPTFTAADMGSSVGDLLIGEVAIYTASFTLTIEAVSGGGVSNSVEATALPVFGPGVPGVPTPISDVSDDGVDTDGNIVDDPTEVVIAPSLAPTGLVVEKTTPRGVVERGSVVPYTITVTNNNPVVSGTLNIVDVLPPGFLYVPDSAMLDGAVVPIIVSGRVLTWPNVPVPPLTTVTATLSARVTTGTQAGEHVNTASIRNPATNGLMAPVATATVRIQPEPVFDCGDVIGKVFDDANRDGYQNKGEMGIPAVRLAGVDGTIITTDEFGRFHVPCAMLPADRGSNFILKIDTRSLPSGYRLTTENPRVVRLTPGKLTEMNFGASITRVVRIDINIKAFAVGQDGRAELAPALVSGIAKLLPRIVDEAVNLRIAYHLPAAASTGEVKRARALMRLVEKHIRQEWRDIGQVKLTIEHTLLRVGQ